MKLVISLLLLTVTYCNAASVISFDDSQDSFDTSDPAPRFPDFGSRVPIRTLVTNQGYLKQSDDNPFYSHFGGARRLSDDSEQDTEEPSQEETPAPEESDDTTEGPLNPFGDPPHSKRRLTNPSDNDEEDQSQQSENDEKNPDGSEDDGMNQEAPEDNPQNGQVQPPTFSYWNNPWSYQHPWYSFVSQNVPGTSYIATQNSVSQVPRVQPHISYINPSISPVQTYWPTPLKTVPAQSQQNSAAHWYQINPSGWYTQPQQVQYKVVPSVQTSAAPQSVLYQPVKPVHHYSQQNPAVPAGHSYVVSQTHPEQQPSSQHHGGTVPVVHSYTVPQVHHGQQVVVQSQKSAVPTGHSYVIPQINLGQQQSSVQDRGGAVPVVQSYTTSQIHPGQEVIVQPQNSVHQYSQQNSVVPASYTYIIPQTYLGQQQQSSVQNGGAVPVIQSYATSQVHPGQQVVVQHQNSVLPAQQQSSVQTHQGVLPVAHAYSLPQIHHAVQQSPLLHSMVASKTQPSSEIQFSKPSVQTQGTHYTVPSSVVLQPHVYYHNLQNPSVVASQPQNVYSSQSVHGVHSVPSQYVADVSKPTQYGLVSHTIPNVLSYNNGNVWPYSKVNWSPTAQVSSWNGQASPWNNQWFATQSHNPEAWSSQVKH